MSKTQDEADKHKAGRLDGDPRAETKAVDVEVPRVYSVSELMRDARTRAFTKNTSPTCTTGHYKLDKVTGGIRRGFTWLFGADTSFGKSSWLVSVADENLKAGKRVLIVSSEDTPDVYADRLMARRSGVNAMNLRDQRLTDDEIVAVTDVANAAEPVPVYIDARRAKVEELVPHLRAVIREHKIDVVAFDYIQEFQSKKRWQDERVKYREIASQLRHVAKDEKIAAVLFSQLTMNSETKIPNRHNIRECRDIANAAEVIIIGFEPGEEIEGADGMIPKGTKCLFVDKVKNGPRGGKLPMDWNAHSACFNTVKNPEQQAYDRHVPEDVQNFGDNVGEKDPW